jgi:hypothetical protein
MKFKNFSPLNNDAIIVDGLWGSGKSITPNNLRFLISNELNLTQQFGVKNYE